MKYALLIFVFLTSNLLAELQANSPEFNQATLLYSQKKYVQAQTLYQSLLQKGLRSQSLFYNLGNTYYQQGDLANARLSWEKALLLAPSNKTIQKNLAFIKPLLEDKEDSTPQPLHRVYDFVSDQLNGYQWLIICIGSVMFSGICLWSVIIWPRKWLFRIMTTAIIITLIFFIFSWTPITTLMYPAEAIIITDRVEIKSGPTELYATLFVLHKGTKIRIEKENNKWVFILFGRSLSGWIPKIALNIIEIS